MAITIYKAEKEAGIAELVKNTSSLSYLAQLKPSTSVSPLLRAKALEQVKSQEKQIDLYYTNTVLATTGWNINTDVFDRGYVWAARSTPEDKPFNFEHNPSHIIGHITASMILDEKAENIIPDDTAFEDLPPKFHIASSAVIYRHLTTDLEERMAKLISEIENGEWFVSQECLFNGFDYAVIDPNGVQRVITRNEDSAFLSKYLRAYGGDGVYKGYKLGRLMHIVAFSGKGLVKKPANPESVFIKPDDSVAFNGAYAKIIEIEKTNSGYSTADTNTDKESNTMSELDVMKSEIEKIQSQLKKVESERDSTLSTLKEAEAEIDSLKAQVSERDEKIKTLEAQILSLATEKAELIKQLDLSKAEAKKLEDEVEKAKKEKRLAFRKSSLVEAGVPADKIDATLASLENIDDAAFEVVVAFKKEAAAAASPTTTTTETSASTVLDGVIPSEEPTLGVSTSSGDKDLEASRAYIANYLAKNFLKTAVVEETK